VATCPRCSAPAQDDASFCSRCGAPLGTATGSDPPVEERRVVSIVFADLAGFTERSDLADPEDVRRILVPFHAAAQEEIERFGGVLDKFIGDAAMGVFGAPSAHEDDAERAVRAALALRDRAETDLVMPVRIAVNTGEALVVPGRGPQIGERVAGDVVNTASRLQGVASTGQVVLGETTARAVRSVIDLQELDPVRVKGKGEPLEVWLARSVRTSAPDRDEDDPPPFVGRERERSGLLSIAERCFRTPSPHMVTVVGEPGLGKSRLVADLGATLNAAPHAPSRSTRMHRGRCLPFGERITFAALDDIVRALLEVAPTDGGVHTFDALDRSLAALEPDEDERSWLRSRLAPLIAPVEDDDPVDLDESFTAWTRFLELEATRGPLMLVIEDLHWAEPAMLDFLDSVTEHAEPVPLLIVCTARPELHDDRPTSEGDRGRASTLTLSALSEGEMRQLLGALLARSMPNEVPDELEATLVQRAGGNPLYAREFASMLQDRSSPPQQGGQEASPSLQAPNALPETVQALIASRLDILAPNDRTVLQAASVVGDRCWPGVITALAPGMEVGPSLTQLQRRGFLRRSPVSSVEGQAEYAITHGLIRDVAYGRLPRTVRARMHRSVATWLESTMGADLADRADMVASHATRALDLAMEAGLSDDIDELRQEALHALIQAGERQSSLDVRRAAEYLARALELTPSSSPERADLLRLATGAGWRSGSMTSEQAVVAYREAVELAREADDPRVAGRAMRRLYFQLGLQGQTDEARRVLDEAITMLEGVSDPGTVLAELYACRAEAEMFAGRSEGSLRWADRALELEVSAETELMALHLRGNARCELGDLEGLTDLRAALETAEASGRALDIVTSMSYLVEWIGLLDGVAPALATNQAAIDLSDRRGLKGQAMWARAESMWLLFDSGRWDEIVERAGGLLPWSAESGDAQVGTIARAFRIRVDAHRGEPAHAAELTRTLEAARRIQDLQILAPTLIAAGVNAGAAGRHDEVPSYMREFDEATAGGPAEYRELLLPEATRIVLTAGDTDLAERLLGERTIHSPRTSMSVEAARAAILEQRADPAPAADAFRISAEAWAAWGIPFERGQALMGMARCLRRSGAMEEADRTFDEAAGIFRSLGATVPPLV
jgi:class 3 adenylate cyclase/tetratricopeptide (TPR) repeat protein